MRKILNILALLLLTSLCLGQSNFTFSIEQIELPEGDFYKYEFVGKALVVIKNKTKITIREFNKNEITQIDSAIGKIGLDTIKENYSRQVLDGVCKTFIFKLNGFKKEIKLENYYIENLDIFLNKVNSYLETKNRLISFNEDLLSSPDTVVNYLPDFYIEKIIIPKHYHSYIIDCFRKGHYSTKILDSIHHCDCRVYPTDDNSNYKKYNYWRAFRLDSNYWRKEYFDSNNKIIKIEHIQDIIPYEIIKEDIHKNIGTKPLVVIYRYYKTKIKK